MCTVTCFYRPGGMELFFNRDERLTRSPAEPPRLQEFRGRGFVAPRDGDFGGSWIAVNECGLILCLLNGYTGTDPPEPPGSGYTSRGLLITSLIDSNSPEQLERRLRVVKLEQFRSFALACFDVGGVTLLANWSAGRLDVVDGLDVSLPLISSSFRAEDVAASRATLFREMEEDWNEPREELHLAYHASHRPFRGAHSPCMHREDATTVSFSRIVVSPQHIDFHYTPGAPGDDQAEALPPVRLARAGS